MKRSANILLAVGSLLGSMGEAQQTPSLQYAAKFMCGKATPSDTMPPVAPGTYYTAINVHNPSGRFVILRKKFAVALPFERAGEISRFIEAKLGPDEAMEIDCQEILNIFRRPPFPPIGRRIRFLKGFAVLEPDSAAELDVVAVYTAAGATGQVDALDIERVPVRRVIGGLPDLVPVPDPRKGFCQRDSLGRLVITVKNQGSADAGPSQTTVDFAGVGSVSVPTPAIAAGSSVTLPSVAIPPGCFHPNCNFRIIVDATALIAESDEGNNVATGSCIG